MSLINDVLKDLERRQAAPGRGSPMPARDRAGRSRHRPTRWPLWLLAAVATGAILHLSLDSPDPPGRSGEPRPLVAQAEAKPEPRSIAAPADVEMPQPQAARQPERADAGDRPEITSPRPAPVAPDAADQPKAEARPVPAPTSDTVSNPGPAAAEQRGSDSEAEPAETQGQDATISIRRSVEDDDAEASDPLADAKRLLARGQVHRAESRLRQVIRQRPDLTEGHELLARALMERERPQQAAEALEAGLAQAAGPDRLAALLGRLLLERGESARARSILAEHAPDMAEAPEHHLLLAAALRQTGDHEAAAEHYRRLSEVLPHRAAVWIGLGASLESLDRPAQAANAYNRATEGDDARAASFARQRLDALEPLIGEPQ
ncbi:tetratricopeptide repeat protein [Wenzhouxiangella sp. EGI_FJ10409]|uniref:tetratricopeptide repeat protein n=1 Tax=Wenzhouxiangella sp. EGI_FJ10409 TaxID=3243767 RepID=UPI0035D59984